MRDLSDYHAPFTIPESVSAARAASESRAETLLREATKNGPFDMRGPDDGKSWQQTVADRDARIAELEAVARDQEVAYQALLTSHRYLDAENERLRNALTIPEGLAAVMLTAPEGTKWSIRRDDVSLWLGIGVELGELKHAEAIDTSKFERSDIAAERCVQWLRERLDDAA